MSDFKKQIIVSIFKIIVVVLLGLFVLVVPSFIMMSFHNLPELLESKPWLGGFINHTAMLVLSILIMLVLSKYNNRDRHLFSLTSLMQKHIIDLCQE